MNELVEMINKEPRVSTFNLWKGFGYGEHRALKRLITDNKKMFETFGILRTEMQKIETTRLRGRPDKGFLLNERQAMLLIATVRPCEEANKFKVILIKEFFRFRDELAKLNAPSAHIAEIRKILLLFAPSEWVKLFPDEFYTAIMKLYGQDFIGNNHTPPYCGAITKRWIYDRVLPPELNQEIDLKIRNERKHQWFTEQNGRATLGAQINQVTGIARMSRDRKQFEENCAIAFEGAPLQLSVFL